MPLYEYECGQCGSRFERRQSVHDDPVSTCPDCGGAVRRVLFPVGIIFKGSGFYVTDSRGKQPIGSSNGDGGSNGSKPKEEAAKTESKPAESNPPASPAKESKEPAGAKA